MSRKRKKVQKQKKFSFRWFCIKSACLLCAAAVAANFLFQIANKPAEILAIVGLGSAKLPSDTWQAYSPYFNTHSTNLISAEFLAALAQVESSGNPLASPKWKLNLDTNSLGRIYSPLSTSVGLYQFTDGTFDQAKQYCVHNGKVRQRGPWYKLNSCWFNWTYLRVSPSDSIELASAYLHATVEQLLAKHQKKYTQHQVNRLAAIIHLCGSRVGDRFIRAGFTLKSISKCGSHSVRRYISRLERYKDTFAYYANRHAIATAGMD